MLSSLFYRCLIEVIEIIHGCIEIHHKNCRGWIIVMGFRVLLILQHLFREILVEVVLGVHEGSVKIKSFLPKYCNNASSTQGFHEGLPVLVCTRRTIYS
jgi:hypothetical protein